MCFASLPPPPPPPPPVAIPEVISIEALNGTTIMVRWSYNATVIRPYQYLVRVMVSGSENWTDAVTMLPGQDAITVVMVGSLVPFTWYDVQVVALQNGGTSVGSKVFAVMTPTAAPWEAPSGLVATPIISTETMLTWVVSAILKQPSTHSLVLPCVYSGVP